MRHAHRGAQLRWESWRRSGEGVDGSIPEVLLDSVWGKWANRTEELSVVSSQRHGILQGSPYKLRLVRKKLTMTSKLQEVSPPIGVHCFHSPPQSPKTSSENFCLNVSLDRLSTLCEYLRITEGTIASKTRSGQSLSKKPHCWTQGGLAHHPPHVHALPSQ